MIVLSLAAAIAIRFAPPIGMPLHYRITDRTTAASGEAQIETDTTMVFRRETGMLIASQHVDAVRVSAPPRRKPALEALFAPLIGVSSEARIGPDGDVAALLATDARWAAHIASQMALRARIDADPSISSAARAVAYAAIARAIQPANRDPLLKRSIAQLLPPQLPPLAAGATSTDTTSLETPAGDVPARTTVTLLRADGDAARYRIETVTAPSRQSQDRLADVSDVTIDRHTGLLAGSTSSREMRRDGAAAIVISTRLVTFLR